MKNYLTTDIDQEIKAKKTQEILKDELNFLRADIQKMMDTAHGRRVIDWIMRISQPYQNHFAENPQVTAHNLGRAYVGTQLHMLLIDKCPDKYFQMLNEYKSRNEGLRKNANQ
jgi:hypothetical protein